MNLALAVRSSALAAAVGLAAASYAQEAPTRSITRITGDLYRATQNAHHTVFLVTSEGLVLADPIDRGFATWLKSELARRFDAPVRYVLYSHHHQDHASGGAVFDDTAELIGHESMVENLKAVQGDAAYADVRPPERTYSDEVTIELGGKRVRILHALPSHSDDSSIIHFPDERAVFAVDFVNVRRLPYRTIGTGSIRPWIEANRDLQQRVDYDIMAPGHGPVGTKADVDASARYLEELLAAVREAMAGGQDLEQIKQSVRMEEYADWAQYDAWRAENVEAAYRTLSAE